MIRRTVSLAALLFILVSPLSLCAAEEQTIAPETPQEKEQYEKGMKERLGKLGSQLDELKATAAAKSEEAGEKVKGYLAEAEKKRKAAAQKFEELGKASKDTWGKFTSEMDTAAKDFERAFERAKSRKE